MDENLKMEAHLSSAAAFVEGGIQDACDDACSICLEAFCDSDPSTVTGCKHEFHLQCILEWCQRSSQCPMCWQHINLKDPASQELLEAVQRERSFRQRRPCGAIFHHPTLGDFELQHLPVDASEADLEERIIQHLAAAAAMGRAHITRREGHRGRARGHGRPQYLVFSTNPSTPPVGPVSTSSSQTAGESENTNAGSPSSPVVAGGREPAPLVSYTLSNEAVPVPQTIVSSTSRSHAGHPFPANPDRAGPSELHSLSESLKSRFNAVSTRCKESFIKSTRGWRERLFSRNQFVADVDSEVRRQENAEIATVSQTMEQLNTRENSSVAAADTLSVSHIPRTSGSTESFLREDT